MIRVLEAGAQGTGKTTILNYYKDTFLTPITEVVRNLVKSGKVKANEDGDEESQRIIFDEYKKLLSQEIDYISDRSLIDVIAYTDYLLSQGKVCLEVFNNQLKELSKFIKEYSKELVVCYFPIEFDVVDDGFRSTDEVFREKIDSNIKKLLDTYFPNQYITIHGTVEERINQINKEIDNRLIDDYTNRKTEESDKHILNVV